MSYQRGGLTVTVNPLDDKTVRYEKWNPTEKEFAAYLKRELELAAWNSRDGRDLKVSLHSPDTVSRYLASK